MPEPKHDVLLERFAWTPEFGTFGLFTMPGFQWYSLEREWADNQVDISCIPEGIYTIKLAVYYPKNGEPYACYEIMDVPRRTLIKIHVANIFIQLKGCVALGIDLGLYRGMWSVVNSRRALNQFMAAMDGREEAILKISHIEAGGVI